MGFGQHHFTCWSFNIDWFTRQSLSSSPTIPLTERVCCNTVTFQNRCVCFMHVYSNTGVQAIVASANTQCLLVTLVNYRILLQVHVQDFQCNPACNTCLSNYSTLPHVFGTTSTYNVHLDWKTENGLAGIQSYIVPQTIDQHT